MSRLAKKPMLLPKGVDVTVSSEAVKAAQNAMKFDYAKFGEGVMKAYQTTAKK